MSQLFTIGHRGASGEEPENTLRAVRRALELGVDGVEIDVQRTCDGELVVIHDPTLDRTTNGCGAVAEMTLEAIRQLDAGKGERVPTLREVIEQVAGRAWLNIELKAKGTALRVLEEIAWAERELGVPRKAFTISSFDHEELALVANSGVPIGVLLSRWRLGVRRLVRRLDASTLHLSARAVTAKRVAFAKALGLRVLVYTVNESAEAERLHALGVDGLFTDFPARMPKCGEFGEMAPKMQHEEG